MSEPKKEIGLIEVVYKLRENKVGLIDDEDTKWEDRARYKTQIERCNVLLDGLYGLASIFYLEFWGWYEKYVRENDLETVLPRAINSTRRRIV